MAETAELLHVVLAEWNDGVDATDQATTLSDEHLTTIDGVLSVSSGPTVSGEGLEGGFDWMLVVRFRDRAALEAEVAALRAGNRVLTEAMRVLLDP